MSKRTKIMALVGLMLVGAFVVFMGVGGFTATSIGSISVTAGVAPTIQLTTGDPINFGTVAPGTPVSRNTTMTVNSNKTWGMTVTKDGNLTDGTNIIPSGDLTYTSDGGVDVRIKGEQVAATQFGTATNVCAGSDRGSGEVVTISYTLNLSSWDAPADASYTATHTYTATN